MYHIGKSFRIFRKERGYTLKSMSDGIISFSYLSKFEKEQSDITLSTLIRLMRRLNMSIDEFLFFNNIKTTEYNDLFKKVSIEYSKNNASMLLKYFNEEMESYYKTKKTYYKCNSIAISAILSDIDATHKVSVENQNFLMDYLMKCTYWSNYEVSLFGNTLSVIPEASLLVLLKEIEKRAVEYKISQKNIRDIIALLENACIVLLRKNKLEEAKTISTSLDSFIKPNYFFEKTRKMFIDGIIKILEGKMSKGKEEAEKAIEIISYMDNKMFEDYNNELNYFLKE